MKTAVSIPDDLFHRADELARALGMSRSRLYQEALAEYVLRRDADSLTEELNQVLAEVGGEPDPWLAEAARVTLERGEW